MAAAPKGSKKPGGAPAVALILGGPPRKGGSGGEYADDDDEEDADESMGDEEFVSMLETLLDETAEPADRRAALRELVHDCK